MFPKRLLVLLALLVFYGGCKKSDQYPIEPVISFESLTTTKNLQGYDTEGTLRITFTDGDGDIGLNVQDTLAPYVGEYSDNVHMIYYEYISGNWTAVPQYNDNGKIPVITPEGNQKAIRGEIRKDHIGFPFGVTNRRIRFDVYIYDRALHKSNVITTPEIVISTQ